MKSERNILKPKNLSSYELRERLGEGLSSEVIAAIKRDGDGLSEQAVVLKILKSQTAVSWLQGEFAALRAVDSLYCVRVLGWESFATGPALVLERVDGVTLHELGRRFQLSEAEIDEIAFQVEQGLHDLHVAAVFHGDLSPKNILLDRSGVVKLIDFGAAGTSELVGTAAYISHQRWGGANVSAATDFASWTLIASDVRSRFDQVPLTTDAARLRALELAELPERPVRTESRLEQRKALSHKVQLLQSERLRPESTVVLSAQTQSARSHRYRNWRVIAPFLLLLISASVFSDPEPLQKPMGVLRISTMKWVEVRIDDGPAQYAPLVLSKIGAGRHRLQWRSQLASGAFEVVVRGGAEQTLRDVNFKH